MDPNVSLAARNNLLFIVEHWSDLRARLVPGGGNALNGMPSGTTEGHAPIDIGISDLLFAVEEEARTLGHVLMDETDDWTPRTSRMPWLLADVAARYGHWTAGEDERAALDFCDWAEEYAEKVRWALERPAPPTYVGPCQGKGEDGAGCAGELYLREGRHSGRCRECGSEFTTDEQMAFLQSELASRLMTPAEIVRGLKIVGHQVQAATVFKWVQRGKLAPAIEGERLYRFADALGLVGRREKVAE